jgi:pentapeptide repeat protein
MAAEDPRTGRTPFEPRPSDKDYSGLTIVDRYLEDTSLEKSFFNGVALSNCWFDSVAMNNVEFCETRITRSQFRHCNLAGSDFVDSILENVIFTECNFEKGEWRESSFRVCTFIRCTFSHTTVSLCTFTACSLDEQTITTVQDRAAYFNVFSMCKFAINVTDEVFAARNFGVPATVDVGRNLQPNIQQSLEQMCLLNNLGNFRVISLADVATSICTSLSGSGNRRSSSLTFFSKIVTVLTNERRISATSLMYLEQLITGFGGSIEERDLLMAAMAAVLEIHTALLTVASEVPSNTQSVDGAVRSITIHFSETYGWRDIEIFRDALALAGGTHPTALDVDDVRTGSTIVELASTVFLTTGTVLTGLTFVLRQAKIVVDRATDLKRSINKYKKVSSGKKPRSHALAVPAKTRVAAILEPEAVVPGLKRIHNVVERHGRVLSELDERATVRILTEKLD